jgi:hypothetical protein
VAFRRPTKAFQDAITQGGANLRMLNARGASMLEGVRGRLFEIEFLNVGLEAYCFTFG